MSHRSRAAERVPLSPYDLLAHRARIDRAVEVLIAYLDFLDGDPDLEPSDNGIADLPALLRIKRQRR